MAELLPNAAASAAIYYFGSKAIAGDYPSYVDTAVTAIAVPVATGIAADLANQSVPDVVRPVLLPGAAAASSFAFNRDVTRSALAAGAVYVTYPVPEKRPNCTLV